MTVQSANVHRLRHGQERQRRVAKDQSPAPPRLLAMVSPEQRRDAGDDARRKRARTPTGHSLASAASSFSNAQRRLAGVEAGLERARTDSWAPASVSRSRHNAATATAGQVSQKTSRPPAPPRRSSESIKRGDQVLVRTPVGNLPTGQVLVLWLSAVAVSDNEDGHLRVVYNGKFPLDDPYRTVRVAAEDVKKMPPADGSSDGSTGSSTVTTAASHKP